MSGGRGGKKVNQLNEKVRRGEPCILVKRFQKKNQSFSHVVFVISFVTFSQVNMRIEHKP